MPDRERKDGATRDRVDEIGASMESYRERLDARYRVVVRWVTFSVVVAIVAPSLLLIRTNHQAESNTTALCALRGKVQSEVNSSEKFLREHPFGVAGIATAKEIADDIASRKATVRTLSGLDCP